MANEEGAVALRPQSDISVNKPTAPTVIGSGTHINYSVSIHNHGPPAIQEPNVDTRDSNNYEQGISSGVQEKIAQIDKRNPPPNSQDRFIRAEQIDKRKNLSPQQNNQENNFDDHDHGRPHDELLKEESPFYKVDEEIQKFPNTSYPLLETLVNHILQTQDKLTRSEWLERVNQILDMISDNECFRENACGIYQAEEILREFLIRADPVIRRENISTYAAILSVMLKNGALPRLKQHSLKLFLSALRELIRLPLLCPCTRICRDVKAVIEMSSRSVNKPKMLQDGAKFISTIQEAGSSEKIIGLCKKSLKRNSWFQHFLIITWLKMEVLKRQEKNLLSILLQVISYLTKKWHRRRQSYRWKLTLTVVESLTKISTMIPGLSNIAIAGDTAERLHGLVSFSKILKDQKCKDIFNQHARLLVYIENSEIRHLLLTGIFRQLEVASKEIVKERLKRTPSMKKMGISETLHDGKNTVILSGHFEGSKVVAKCYKLRRDKLTAKLAFQATVNPEFENESFMLSYLRRGESHSNIVEFITCDKELSCVVLKHVSQGCLLKFLRHRRTKLLAPKLTDQVSMIIQIADALFFLERKKVIHAGIKAANVLLDESYHVKLSGFRSSHKRDAAASDNIRIEDEHVKWMDPERLSGQPVCHATDIWSLGVLMYEILTYGCVPYNNPVNNFDHGDFKRKPMTASQAKVFVVRGGSLPKHPCIPESLFQLMSEKVFGLHTTRPTAKELTNLLQEQYSQIKEEMENSPQLQPIPPPPELRYLKEDVGPEEYNPGIINIEDQDEDFPFVHLDVLDLAWNDEFVSNDQLYNEETYTNADPEKNEPVLCSTRGYTCNQGDHLNNIVVLEYKEFRYIKHAEKLRTLDDPNLVKVLAINRFGPNKLEMVSQSFPLGNVLYALLSTPALRQHNVSYMIQAASAVVYLHDKGILHGCLKGENILLENEKQIKLCRLGLSKEVQDVNKIYVDVDEMMAQQNTNTDVRWNPIEVVRKGICSKESEYWSFGIVCWEMSKASNSPSGATLGDIRPYKEFKDNEVFSRIKQGRRLQNPDISSIHYIIYTETSGSADEKNECPFLVDLRNFKGRIMTVRRFTSASQRSKKENKIFAMKIFMAQRACKTLHWNDVKLTKIMSQTI